MNGKPVEVIAKTSRGRIVGHITFARRLRIMHNGNVPQKNPHWHLWIYQHGNLYGEIIGHQSDFKGIQGFEKHLDESDIVTLFSEAVSMRHNFKMREVVCLPDDVMVELNEYADGKENRLFWYVIPREDQGKPEVSAFLRIVSQIFEPYA
jgi:hypothetical protein